MLVNHVGFAVFHGAPDSVGRRGAGRYHSCWSCFSFLVIRKSVIRTVCLVLLSFFCFNVKVYDVS